QLWKLAHRGRPGALRGERADVHLVDHLPANRRACPSRVAPRKGAGVDHARRPLRAPRLKPRGRVGIQRVVLVELEAIERAHRGLARDAGEIAVTFGLERHVTKPLHALEYDHDARSLRRPDTKVHAAIRMTLCPDG